MHKFNSAGLLLITIKVGQHSWPLVWPTNQNRAIKEDDGCGVCCWLVVGVEATGSLICLE